MSRLLSLRITVYRLLRRVVIVIVLVLLLPYLLTPLYRYVMPVSTPMVWRWITRDRVVRNTIPIKEIAPVLVRTVVVAEDGRFCSHSGVDWHEIREAMEEADDIEAMRGGSTITQQVAKNLFLWSGRSIVRKGLEFPLALWIDFVLPKQRVLEIYLNVAEWGPNGEFGVEAGARRAFNKSARNVTSGEAALLAAVLPNPVRRSAREPKRGLRRVAGLYEARAASAGPAVDACVRTR
ncbi:MAG TPA: transglycosylase domain-containing protein [Xanthobacteraceae bacterium]|nr:transglycosylase domain-containing protein [Xanthobacteraceae bacterium]